MKDRGLNTFQYSDVFISFPTQECKLKIIKDLGPSAQVSLCVQASRPLGIHATQTQTDTHTHAQVALCSLPTLSSLTLTGSDLVRASAEENPCPWQIFDDVIFARLETEADVDICVTVCLLSSRPLLPFPSLPLLSHLPSKLVK